MGKTQENQKGCAEFVWMMVSLYLFLHIFAWEIWKHVSIDCRCGTNLFAENEGFVVVQAYLEKHMFHQNKFD